jgi:hypothetical protein
MPKSNASPELKPEHQVLPFPERRGGMFAKSAARWWMLMGASALAVPGLFAIVLVIARGGSFSHMPVFTNMFTKALVVHVDLLVLVWFLSMSFMLWSLAVSTSKAVLPYIEEAAQFCFALGMALIALSAFDPAGEAMKSNYIPVIMSPVFFVGLSLLLSGVLLMLARLLATTKYSDWLSQPQQFGIFTSGLITLMAIVCFAWSHAQMPPEITGEQYYDISFWGGGHVLQFLHTQSLMICWLLLAKAVRPQWEMPQSLLYVLFCLGLVSALCAPLAYLLFDVHSMEHRQFFTWQMITSGALAPLLLFCYIGVMLWQSREERKQGHRALWSALLMSCIVFVFGGLLGSMIHDENTLVPAHYHGSIVGITLAFMGVSYLLLPLFGYRDMTSNKLAYWQPIICGVGQLMHSSGLAWSGGYGALRKTPGGIANASLELKIGMGVMEWGGLFAVVGGVMYIIVIYKAVRSKNHTA